MTSTDRPSPSSSIRRIVLTGFMGSGKSTVGPLVAQRLGWRFIDVDDVIEAETAMPITEFFRRHGEAQFRAVEHAVIARFAGEEALVLGLGGGAIESGNTRELLLNSPGTLLVHLEVRLETTLARCRGSEHTRPVLADQAHLTTRYERRLPLYRMAHVSIAADDISPEQVTKAILDAITSPQD